MPAKTYICTNVAGGCARAFSKELINIEPGQEPDCPVKNCRENLKPAGGGVEKKEPAGGGGSKTGLIIGILAAVLLVTAGGGFFAYREYFQPRPDQVDAELNEIFPELPAAKGDAKK